MVTIVLVCINVIIFLVMWKDDPSSFMHPSIQMLLRAGANFGPLTVNGEGWRLLSSAFVHSGIFHILLNMGFLNSTGYTIESEIGSLKFFLIYFISALAGSITSIYFHPTVVSAGASGALFGLLGMELLMIWNIYSRVSKTEFIARLINGCLAVIAYLSIGLLFPILDNFAHLGGLIGGLLSGLVLCPLNSKNKKLKIWNLIGVVCLLFILQQTITYAFARVKHNPAVIKLTSTNSVKNALQKHQLPFWLPTQLPSLANIMDNIALNISDHGLAILLADKQLEFDPDNGYSYYVHAVIEHKSGDDSRAIKDLNAAVTFSPKDYQYRVTKAKYELGIGQIGDAEIDAQRALTLSSNNADAKDIMCCIQLLRGNLKSSRSWVEKAIKTDPELNAPYFHRAILNWKDGNKLAAKQDIIRSEDKHYVPEGWEKRICPEILLK